MTLLQQLNAAKDSAGRSIQAARALGEELRVAETEKNEAKASELAPKFETASADAAKDTERLNRIAREIELEKQAGDLTNTDRLQFRASTDVHGTLKTLDFKSNKERRLVQRQLEARREMFSRAGVQNAGDLQKFQAAHSDAMAAFIFNGPVAAMKEFESAGFKARESMALVSNDDSLGGFLTADDLQAEVLRDLPTFSNLRGICRVIPTSSNVVVFPVMQSATGNAANKYSTGFAGSWKAEGYVTGGNAPTVQNQPRFGQARIPVHVWAPDAVELTPELLGDSRADLEGILAGLFAETLALDEETAFINGTGVNQPLGLLNTLTDTSITAITSKDATSLTYEGLIDLFAGLPSQYRKNAKFLMNSLTYGVILKLKDAVGMPLFPVNTQPGTLWGKEIVFSEFVPDVAASAYPIIFGDFSYYGIADRMEMRVQRLVERYAPNVGLLPTAREGGQPLRVNAFRKQSISA